MMFSCMNALLSRKDTLQLFQIKKKKKTDNVHHVKVCPLCFPPTKQVLSIIHMFIPETSGK